jgi:large subunit ribosomal protein L15
MPLIRRIPKRGFNNAVFTQRFAPVNLNSLDLFSDGAKVDEASLRQVGLVKGDWAAKSALEAAGAKVTLLKR